MPTILTIAIAVLSSVLAVAITRYYSSRRRLALVIPSFCNIIDVRGVTEGKLQILHDGKPVKSLWAVKLVLRNAGNADIRDAMVRRVPSISFGDKALAIDIEPVYVPDGAVVNATIDGGGSVLLSIGYLGRRSQAAFQVLVFPQTDTSLEAGDITADTGLIEDTDVDFANFLSGGFPTFMDHFTNVIRRYRKGLANTYMLLSVSLIVFGTSVLILACMRPSTANSMLKGIVKLIFGTSSFAAAGCFMLLNGCLLLFPTWFLWRRIRYLAPFDKKTTAGG